MYTENTLPNKKSQWALQKHNYFVIFFPMIHGRYPSGTHWVSQQIIKFLKKHKTLTPCIVLGGGLYKNWAHAWLHLIGALIPIKPTPLVLTYGDHRPPVSDKGKWWINGSHPRSRFFCPTFQAIIHPYISFKIFQDKDK